MKKLSNSCLTVDHLLAAEAAMLWTANSYQSIWHASLVQRCMQSNRMVVRRNVVGALALSVPGTDNAHNLIINWQDYNWEFRSPQTYSDLDSVSFGSGFSG
jgi:hypothetical protein